MSSHKPTYEELERRCHVAESGILLKSVLESNSEVIFFALDNHYCYIAFNTKHQDTMKNIWGKDIAVGVNMLDDIIGSHPDREKAKVNFDRALHGENFVLYEEYGDEKLSRLYWEDMYSPIYSDAGEIIGLTCFVLNITKRMQAETALRESEEKYRDLVENAPTGVFRTNSLGQPLSINKTMARILGCDSPQEAIDHYKDLGVQLYVHSERREEFLQLLREHGHVEDFEYEAKTIDGVLIWLTMNARVKKFDDGASFVIEGFTSDITARKHAEIALRESENRLENILFSIADWVWEVDRNGVYTFSSQKSIDILGRTPEEIIGKTPFDFMQPDEAARIEAVFSDSAARRATIRDIENWNITKNGERVCLLTNGVPILDENGELIGYRGADKDITEQKRSEEEKARLEAQLLQAQKMESVARLAGGVAHDFNNMLGVILGHTEMVIDQIGQNKSLHDDMLEIQKAAKRSADLTRQLLAFARKQIITPKVLNLNETVESTIKMLERLIGENIELIWKPCEHIWPVRVDPSQIDQILANLCVNARDAIAGIGTVVIETGTTVLDKTYCADHPGFTPGNYVVLAVSDDGCGMSGEIQEKLFEPFFTTKETGKGTGLGLATIYGIIKQNNGFINVYSEPGQGATFRIYLPRYSGAAGQHQAEDETKTIRRGNETILLVEDEPSNLVMTTRILESIGYAVLPASSPGNALNLARENADKIKLLVTDVVMPEMNGRDMARILLAQYPNLKCLFMSGYTADVIARHGVLEAGVNFIQKPFTIKELSARIRDTLEA